MSDTPASLTRQQQKEQKEEWKAIEDYEGLYEVSNFGRVRRLSGKVLSPIPRRTSKHVSYAQVGLSKQGVSHSTHVHRLVASAFIPNPDNKPQVNHKDGDGLNNTVANLEWATQSENTLHAFHVLGRKTWLEGKKGALHPTSKAVVQLTLDGDFVRQWGAGRDAGREGFQSGCITRCCQGENRTHKGFQWKYAA
jgi:hypothetical protein